jgi:hypothetical protein
MNIDLDHRKMQTLARALRRELGLGDDHRGVLDALARGFGFKSYAAMKAGLPDSKAATPSAERIGYAVLPDGFQVQALDADNQPVEEHREGNAAADPVSTGRPGAPGTEDYAKLYVWARNQAHATAARLGVPAERVFHDRDLEDETFAETLEAMAEDGLIERDPSGEPVDPTDRPRHVEVTFTAVPRAIAVTVGIQADGHGDFVRQLERHAGQLVDRANAALDRMGDIPLSGAEEYGLYLQLETADAPSDVRIASID